MLHSPRILGADPASSTETHRVALIALQLMISATRREDGGAKAGVFHVASVSAKLGRHLQSPTT